jgi:hypothetical protein
VKTVEIKYGLMIDGYSLKRWQYEAIQHINALDYVTLDLILVNKGKRSSFQNVTYRNIWFYLFKKLLVRPSSLNLINMKGELSKVHTLWCTVIKRGKHSEYFSQEIISEITKRKIDFFLRFGFGIIRGDILTTPKYGVWSFHHSDEQIYRGGPYGFWEIYYNNYRTGSILQKLTNKLDGGIVLKRGQFKTALNSYSKNVDNILSKSTKWPSQICIDIHNNRLDVFNNEPTKTSAPVYSAPGIMALLYFCLLILINMIKKLYSYTIFDSWNIGVINRPHSIKDINKIKSEDIKWFPMDGRREFFADPFLICNQNAYYIFYEKYNYVNAIGTISVAQIDQRGNILKIYDNVIESTSHLSYPFIFIENDEYYMIPETSEKAEIALYKCIEFPQKWVKEKIILSGYKGIDSTVVKISNTWWLFTSNHEWGHDTMLNIFYADSIYGEWFPHKNNPVKYDISSTRSAGNILSIDGHNIRPAQDYSINKENRIIIKKITKLNEYDYQEEDYCLIDPLDGTPYPNKIHTISSFNQLTVIDACREISIFSSVQIFANTLIRLKRKVIGL